MLTIVKALGAALLAPVIGLTVSGLVLWDVYAGSAGAVTDAVFACAAASSLSSSACFAASGAPLLALGSMAALAFGLTILAAYALMARLCGANRPLLALVFPPLTFLALLAVAALTLAHAAVIAGAIFVGEQHYFGEAHQILLAFVSGLGAAAAIAVAWSAVRSFGPATIGVLGAPLTPMDEPRLMLLVRELARQMNVKAPDHVVVGMDANFFVTRARVHVPGLAAPLKGRTLFLSAPLMRNLTSGELRAVIAHELAHFANRDTAYSERFAPIYARLANAGGAEEPRKTLQNPFNVPVRAFTDFMAAAFTRNVAAVSRKRELGADALAAQHASPEDLGYALLKVSVLTSVWRREVEVMFHRVSQGRFSRNLSRNFAEQIRYDLDRDKAPDVFRSVMAWQTPHPTDSHPPTDERLAALGLDLERLLEPNAVHERLFSQAPASQVLDDLTKTEEFLTFVYQKALIERGLGKTEDTADPEVAVHRMLVDFIAHVILADGEVDDREVEIAEREAANFVRSFDPRELRERCRDPEILIPLDQLTELAVLLLTPTGFKNLSALLQRVADADGLRHKAETAVLQRVAAAAELATEEKTN